MTATTDRIVKGSRWEVFSPITKDWDEIRVVGVCEGYVIARYKGAAPWLSTVKDFAARVDSGQYREKAKP